MPDDADIPFGPQPEEKLPLVVPDVPLPPVDRRTDKSLHAKRTENLRALGRLCTAIKKNGDPCGFIKQKGTDWCYVHNPNVPEAERQANRSKRTKPVLFRVSNKKPKSVEDVLIMVSARLDAWIAKFGPQGASVESEQVFCDLVRTWVAVKRCDSTEAATALGTFSLQRRQA